jgi:hypothetical protein
MFAASRRCPTPTPDALAAEPPGPQFFPGNGAALRPPDFDAPRPDGPGRPRGGQRKKASPPMGHEYSGAGSRSGAPGGIGGVGGTDLRAHSTAHSITLCQ